jgi:DNA-binding transcriptional MerR regulator
VSVASKSEDSFTSVQSSFSTFPLSDLCQTEGKAELRKISASTVEKRKSSAPPRFGSGEVGEILGIEPWQLHRFLSRYDLTSSGQLGEGRGSRRLYTTEDIYRIKMAMWLIRDGFAPKLVAQIMQRIEDVDFYGSQDEGDFQENGVSLQRADKGPEVRFFRADKPLKVGLESETYYAVLFSTITRIVNERIVAWRRHGKGGSK